MWHKYCPVIGQIRSWFVGWKLAIISAWSATLHCLHDNLPLWKLKNSKCLWKFLWLFQCLVFSPVYIFNNFHIFTFQNMIQNKVFFKDRIKNDRKQFSNNQSKYQPKIYWSNFKYWNHNGTKSPNTNLIYKQKMSICKTSWWQWLFWWQNIPTSGQHTDPSIAGQDLVTWQCLD